MKESGTVYHDYAGNLHFAPNEAGESNVISCACHIPQATEDQVIAILPRGRKAQFLKAGDAEMHVGLAERFIECLLELDVDIGIQSVDVGGEDSIAGIKYAAQYSKKSRKKHNKPIHNELSLSYSLFTSAAVLYSLTARATRVGVFPHEFTLVLDREDIGRKRNEDYMCDLISIFSKHGTTVLDFSWQSRLEEPLLLVPDIVGGLIRRHGVTGEGERGVQLLKEAERSGQVYAVDGYGIDSSAFPDRGEDS